MAAVHDPISAVGERVLAACAGPAAAASAHAAWSFAFGPAGVAAEHAGRRAWFAVAERCGTAPDRTDGRRAVPAAAFPAVAVEHVAARVLLVRVWPVALGDGLAYRRVSPAVHAAVLRLQGSKTELPC